MTPRHSASKTNNIMQHHIDYINYLTAKGGPDTFDYYDLDAWIHEIAEQSRRGEMSKGQLTELQTAFGHAFSPETMQGFAFHKPHGYAGDFEIIDRIYGYYVAEDPMLMRWDIYWQSHPAAEAVRNRVTYFADLVATHLERAAGRQLRVLNLASGPGRDMLEFFDSNPGANILIDCVDQDEEAIAFASDICHKYLDKVCFHQRNALRYRADEKYDLIWSAGLFDYFDDRVFVFMLKKLREMLADGGEIAIGNFSPRNPSRSYMELLEWNLYHRCPQSLKALAEKAGIDRRQIRVDKEGSGVNLFLHVAGVEERVRDRNDSVPTSTALMACGAD